ncbi:hypothetical protein FisN_8Lh042 [Fistulifera solaris]|uniref:HECT domain-containing protein n=1 Tax=Fistulifera solaris TaxID=1519565 RepID=A0A1Z5JD70_FISSO|nr:hypothetical protein FisN_8Lh042 [Fistulifera solaris]|eukprot:GAX11953.1 hypothetical protein FisN_8Lh042 [Fistulifera solaris]
MYIPPAFHRYKPNADEEFDATDTVKLLETPMTPEEEQLLFPAADNKYYWNDIPTLQSEMLKYLPEHHHDDTRKIFQDDELMRQRVSFMEFRQPKTRLCRAYRAVTAYLQQQNWSNSTIHVNFVRGLIDCAPMHLGFHTLAIPEWCYCPLALPAWCHKYQIEIHMNISPDNNHHRNRNRRPHHRHRGPQRFYCKCHPKAPRAFLDHVRDTKRPRKEKEPPRPVVIEQLHFLLYAFLHAYYEHYLVHWKQHDAFYPKDSDNYKRVVGRKFARVQRYRELGIQRQEKLKQETLEHQTKLEEVQKVREKLREILSREELAVRDKRDAIFDRAQEVLGIRTDKNTAKERQPYTRITHGLCKMEYGSYVQEILVDHYVFRCESKKDYKKVCFADSSFEQMELLWKDRTHPVLFGQSINQLTETFFLGMDASSSKENDIVEKAKDEGGPTRQFLSEFWRYLPRVVIQSEPANRKDVHLFEEKEYLEPKSDYHIDRLEENTKREVRRCYRALGRVLGFCIIHEYHISHVVLSRIHRNYLLRGITPKEGYDKTELFYDLKELMGKGNGDNNLVFEALQAMKSDDDMDLETQLSEQKSFETQLRKHVHEYYIDQYKFFLDAIQEGMRLDFLEGHQIPEIFKKIHSWRVDELVFGKAELTVEDVISALDPYYADLQMEPITQEILDREKTQRRVLQKNPVNDKAEGVFVDVVRSMAKDDPDFLATLVLYVLGYDYLPVGVPIIVEFNYSEFMKKVIDQNNSLPMAHTCVHVLKLPGTAYNADAGLLRSKLKMSLDYFKQTKSGFNME